MARATGLVEGAQRLTSFTIARSASALIAADSSTLTDANIPLASAIDCSGYDTILVGAEITGGTNPTMTVEPLFRDSEAADGSRWKRIQLGAPPGVTATALATQNTGALAQISDFVEIRVFGHPSVFLRISAVANAASTTAWQILVRPGAVRPRPMRW